MRRTVCSLDRVASGVVAWLAMTAPAHGEGDVALAKVADVLLENAVVLRTSGSVTVVLKELGAVPGHALLELTEGARLTLADGAVASGLCTNLEPFELKGPLAASEPCPRVAAARSVAPLSPLRADVPPSIPRLRWPRASYVRELDWIRWRAVPGERNYSVSLVDDRAQTLWTTRAEASAVRYPASAPALEAGRWYGVRIQTERTDSDLEPADLGFQMLSVTGREHVARAEARVAAQNLPALAKTWVHALVLRRFRLHGEALDKLRSSATNAYALELAKTNVALGLVDEAVTGLTHLRDEAEPTSYEARCAPKLLERLGSMEGPRQ